MSLKNAKPAYSYVSLPRSVLKNIPMVSKVCLFYTICSWWSGSFYKNKRVHLSFSLFSVLILILQNVAFWTGQTSDMEIICKNSDESRKGLFRHSLSQL